MKQFVEIIATQTVGCTNINNEPVCPICKHRLEIKVDKSWYYECKNCDWKRIIE